MAQVTMHKGTGSSVLLRVTGVASTDDVRRLTGTLFTLLGLSNEMQEQGNAFGFACVWWGVEDAIEAHFEIPGWLMTSLQEGHRMTEAQTKFLGSLRDYILAAPADVYEERPQQPHPFGCAVGKVRDLNNMQKAPPSTNGKIVIALDDLCLAEWTGRPIHWGGRALPVPALQKHPEYRCWNITCKDIIQHKNSANRHWRFRCQATVRDLGFGDWEWFEWPWGFVVLPPPPRAPKTDKKKNGKHGRPERKPKNPEEAKQIDDAIDSSLQLL